MKVSLIFSALGWLYAGLLSAAERTPNVVIIFADDLGYGDLGCYGSKTNLTPKLDKMAMEGLRSERFYVAQPVCSASRAALLTGCYSSRVSIQGALPPKAKIGLNPDETTLAEVMKGKGYATSAIGKWHLGDHPSLLPLRQGFDRYLGLPYSNDMWPLMPGAGARKVAYPPLPLIEGDTPKIAEVTEKEQKQLTTWYTEEAVKFIGENKERPFFVYLAHSMPHVPLYVSGKLPASPNGIYADVMGEIDWSAGEILRALKENGIDDNTLVIFTSDNGPWLNYGTHAGVAGPLREGKGTAWEGGVRVPFIARWPGKIPVAVSKVPMMTIDLLPTIAGIIGAPLPEKPIDGLDVLPILTAKPDAVNPHEAYYFYYNQNELHAVMSGDWKLYLPHQYRTLNGRPGGKDGKPDKYDQQRIATAELYNVVSDIGEKENVAAANPEIVARLLGYAEKARKDYGDKLVDRKGEKVRAPGIAP